MGFFKKLMGKSVSLDNASHEELIEMCDLKGGELKLNSDLMVEEGYYCALVHLDKICDILPSGKYKVDKINTPRLMQYAKDIKTKKGTVSPKAVIADVYFINISKLENNLFKCPYKITVQDFDVRVKVKVSGTFSIKIEDVKKALAALLNDYAYLKKKDAIKELSAVLGYAMYDVLLSEKFTLHSLQNISEDTMQNIIQKVNKKTKAYGVTYSDIKITNIDLPDNYQESSVLIEETEFDKPQPKQEPEKQGVKEKEPVLVATNGDKEASVNTDSVINLGYGGPTPQPTHSNASAQELYESYTKKFESNQQNYSPLSSAPNILGSSQTGILQNRNESAASTSGEELNLLGTNKSIVTPQPNLSVNEYIERGKMIDDLKEFVGEPKTRKPFVVEDDHYYEFMPDEIYEVPMPNEVRYKTCMTCGQRVGMDARFCSSCGSSVGDVIICKACGTKNQGDARFCKICGSKLN